MHIADRHGWTAILLYLRRSKFFFELQFFLMVGQFSDVIAWTCKILQNTWTTCLKYYTIEQIMFLWTVGILCTVYMPLEYALLFLCFNTHWGPTSRDVAMTYTYFTPDLLLISRRKWWVFLTYTCSQQNLYESHFWCFSSYTGTLSDQCYIRSLMVKSKRCNAHHSLEALLNCLINLPVTF